MSEFASMPSPAGRLREAMREGLVVVVVAIALGLFYNAVTGKGIFGEPKSPAPSTTTTGAPEIIPLELAAKLHEDAATIFVDSRHAFDFKLGHIPGAINVPLKEADEIIAGLAAEKGRPVVVYCDGAECNSSLEVGAKFSAAGFAKVHVFFAGWSAWKTGGLRTEEGTP